MEEEIETCHDKRSCLLFPVGVANRLKIDRGQETATPKKKKGYNTWHYRQGTYPAGDILFIMNNRALS